MNNTLFRPTLFKTEELVSKIVFDAMGDDALKFIPCHSIKALERLRKKLKRAMTINNWHTNPANGYSQNGLICFEDAQYKITTSRTSFREFNRKWFGLEFTIKFYGLSAEEVIKIVDLSEFTMIKSIEPCKTNGLKDFVVVTIKGNE